MFVVLSLSFLYTIPVSLSENCPLVSASLTVRWNGYVAAGSPRSTIVAQGGSQQTLGDSVSPPATSTGGAEEAVPSNVRMLLSMGFSYLQVMEAHSIFGDNVNNMLCYLLETETNGSHDGENVSRRKGKAAE
jgi:OTU domain-containing protein 5